MVAPSLSKYGQRKPQGFSHRPGLQRAPSWRVRRFAVRNLGDVTEARLVEMPKQRLQETDTGFAFGLGRVAPNTYPGLDERSEQPRPHRALMIGPVPLKHTPFVPRGIAGLPWCQRTQAKRGPEASLDRFHDAAGLVALEEREREPADGEDLVRAQGRVRYAGLMIAVDDIIEASGRFIPKSLAEALAPALEDLFPLLREAAADPERIEPQGLHLDRLADPRGDDPVPHLGIHPGELHAWSSSR